MNINICENQSQFTIAFIDINRACDVELDIAHIQSCRRLGKKEEGKIRPLLVTCNTPTPKRNLFKNLNKLRDTQDEKLKDVSVDHDQTEQQREEFKALLAEAKRKGEEEGEVPHIWKVRGPPWDRYLKKVKKNQDQH
eukprot:gene4411-4999_t